MIRAQRKRLFLLLVSGLFPCWAQSQTRVFINEFMADNGGSLLDPQGDADDWIELFNPGDEAVDIGGWYLTDDIADPTAWRFSSATILPAKGFILVWADKDDGDAGYHASFALGAGGEEIALYAADGRTLIDSVVFDRQQRDQSLARFPDGGNTWQIVSQPTPGALNVAGVLGVVENVEFSTERGFYEGTISLALSTETEDAEIWFTTDTNTPYEIDPVTGGRRGQHYSSPLMIDRTTCVRAIAVKDQWQDSEVTTHSYLFLNEVLRQSARPEGFPTTWGSNIVDYAMDPRVVDDPAYASSLVEDLKTIPSVSVVLPNTAFFGAEEGIYANALKRHDPDAGEDWERAASMEWVDPVTRAQFGINAGLRIYGGNDSRGPGVAKHGLRFLFKEEYGPTKLTYPLFENSPVERFDTICLRSIWDYSWTGHSDMGIDHADYLRESFCLATMRDMGHTAPYCRHIHLYINGLYWGLYVLSERLDDRFVEDHFGASSDGYDVLKPSGGKTDPLDVMSGTGSRWLDMFALADRVENDRFLAPELWTQVDAEALIDYMLMVFYTGSRDAPTYQNDNRHPHDFYAAAERVPPGPFVFLPWDMGWVLESPWENRVSHIGGRENPGRLLQVLGLDPAFQLLVSDRIQKHFFNNGALSAARSGERYTALADLINGAIVGESARWGDAQRSIPFTRDIEWITEIDRIVNDFIGVRTEVVVDQLRAAGWYPDVAAPVYTVDGSAQHGGRIAHDAQIGMNSSGDDDAIYYTLDGSDPSAAMARLYQSPIHLDKSTLVKARRFGEQWSAASEAVFVVGPLAENLRITEIMMNPGDPNAEFIELANLGDIPVNLNLLSFTQGINITLGDVVLAAGQHGVLVRNTAVFQGTYPDPVLILGEYAGSLANNGERLMLQDGNGEPLLEVTYSDEWYGLADGEGFSLVLRDPNHVAAEALSEQVSWRPSTYLGGSPGLADPDLLPYPGAVVINELLANSASGSPDWIELHNSTDQPIDIGGWWLSDDTDEPTKYQIPTGVVLPAQGYRVFYQGSHFTFGLRANGETVVLQAGIDSMLAGYRQVESFGASLLGVSLGRYEKSTGTFNFVAMVSPSRGLPNSDPSVGPLVISEIMYHPTGDAGAEYVELLNISNHVVALYDATSGQGWRLRDQGDPGINFVFSGPSSLTLNTGERVILTRNLAAFQAIYPVPPQVQVFSWNSGALGNAGDTLQLDRPGPKDNDGDWPWIRADRVGFSDGSHPIGNDPWPVEADGQGQALGRVPSDAYGNDPASWEAVAPTPGN